MRPLDGRESGKLTLFQKLANICWFGRQNYSVVQINHLMKIIQLLLNRFPALFRSKRRGVDSKRPKGVTAFEHSWNIDVIKTGAVQLF